MQLIVAGASGFLASEVIRQALSLPKITSIIALARRPVEAPDEYYLGVGADRSKLKSVVVKEYDEYSEDVKKQFAGADACIWTVAVTPSKSRAMDFEKVRRICQEYTMIGLKAMFEARENNTTPFRFVYVSGTAAERDQTKTPSFMPEYSSMRGETENQVLAFAEEHKGQIDACVAKPGFITKPGNYFNIALATALKWTGMVSNVSVTEVAAAVLNQVTNGFEKEPLQNEDLVRIGRKILSEQEEEGTRVP